MKNNNALKDIEFAAQPHTVAQLKIEGYTQIKQLDGMRYVARVTNKEQFQNRLIMLRKDEQYN